MKNFALAAAAVSALPLFVGAAPTTESEASAAKAALTFVDKVNVVEPTDFIFNFTAAAAQPAPGIGGELELANIANWDALALNAGLSIAVGTINACSMISPHTHPRATEIFLPISGADGDNTVTVGFVTESGSHLVLNNITTLTAAMLPLGSLHFELNNGCNPVKFVAALSNPDPGLLDIPPALFSLPQDVVEAALGVQGSNIVATLQQVVPAGFIAGIQDCYTRCNIPFPTAPGAPGAGSGSSSSSSSSGTVTATGTDSTGTSSGTATGSASDSTSSGSATGSGSATIPTSTSTGADSGATGNTSSRK